MGVRDNLTLFTLNFTLFQCYTLLMLLLHFSNEDTRDTIGCKMKMCFVEKCRDNSSVQKGTVSWILIPTAAATKEGNSKGGENDGRLLIGFYYSAVTGNRKQVLTGSSESCEHKCR